MDIDNDMDNIIRKWSLNNKIYWLLIYIIIFIIKLKKLKLKQFYIKKKVFFCVICIAI